MKVLLDEMYLRRLAEQLRGDGHDVVGVVETRELVARPDVEIAHWAREHGRVVVTENVADFAALPEPERPGLLLVTGRRWPRGPVGLSRLKSAIGVWLREPRDDQHFSVAWL